MELALIGRWGWSRDPRAHCRRVCTAIVVPGEFIAGFLRVMTVVVVVINGVIVVVEVAAVVVVAASADETILATVTKAGHVEASGVLRGW